MREGDAWIVGRVLLEVGASRPFVQGVEILGRCVLPTRVGYERSFRPQGVEQSAHDALCAAENVTERAHAAMDHHRPARPADRASPDHGRAANALPACPTQYQQRRRSANAEEGKPGRFRVGSDQGSGGRHSGMLYHGGVMAGADHEAGSRKLDGLEQEVSFDLRSKAPRSSPATVLRSEPT